MCRCIPHRRLPFKVSDSDFMSIFHSVTVINNTWEIACSVSKYSNYNSLYYCY